MQKLAKLILFLIIIHLFSGCGAVILAVAYGLSDDAPQYVVVGEKSLLDDVQINVETENSNNIKNMQTLLLKGNVFNIKNGSSKSLTIYYSYKEELVGLLTIEGYQSNNNVNNIYVYDDNGIYIKYVRGALEVVSKAAIPINLFMKENVNEKDEKKFFSLYMPK